MDDRLFQILWVVGCLKVVRSSLVEIIMRIKKLH